MNQVPTTEYITLFKLGLIVQYILQVQLIYTDKPSLG